MTIDPDGSIALDDDDDESARPTMRNARAFCFSSFAQTAGDPRSMPPGGYGRRAGPRGDAEGRGGRAPRT